MLGGDLGALSVTRSLGAAGIPVYVLGHAGSIAASSRFCTALVDLGSGEGVQARWLDWLREGPSGAVLLACNDDGLEFVARNRPELVALGYRPFEANDEVVLAMLDKERTYALARSVGVAVPHTVRVRTGEELEAVLDDFDYPCALKPLHSHRWQHHLYGKAVIADSPDKLRTGFARTLAFGLDVLVTEIIPGPEDRFCSFYSYLDERGEPLVRFTKRKLRGYPTSFGNWCYQVTDWNSEVAELGLRFMQGAGVRGNANVEFKRDPRDGQLKLIECNHRFTASNEVVRFSGIDLGLLSYNRVLGRLGPPVDSYREGVYLWHAVEDVRAFLALRRAGELTLPRWLASLLHRQHFPVASVRDPRPSAVRALQLLRRAERRLTRRRTSGAPAQALFRERT